MKGVFSVTSGYSGGHICNPGYDDVIDGQSGHAEVVRITYDPMVIEYLQLLNIFWNVHNPTTLNR